MDLQVRKFKAIEYLIHLQDENIFTKIEELIQTSKLNNVLELKPFSKQQLIDRAIASNQDYVAGLYTSQDVLELESKKW
jgi:hypothetical protein